MFIHCPHCQALVATDPATDAPPARCPRCAEALDDGSSKGSAAQAADAGRAAAPGPAAVPAEPAAPRGDDAIGDPEPLGHVVGVPDRGTPPPTRRRARQGRAANASQAAPQPAADAGATPGDRAPVAAEDAGPDAPDDAASEASDGRHGGPAGASRDIPGEDGNDLVVASTAAAASGPSADDVAGGSSTEDGDPDPAPAKAGPGGSEAATAADAPAPAVVGPPAAPAFARRSGRSARRAGRGWPLAAATVALALLLGVQWLLADRARLAADARWRPVVARACTLFGCALPAWREPSALTLLARDVRAHPRLAGVLHASLTFRNDARWAQPWPRVTLSLADVDGRAVGARTFTPDEYMGDDPTAKGLASGQVATIAFDVVEPGPRVVSFAFEFH